MRGDTSPTECADQRSKSASRSSALIILVSSGEAAASALGGQIDRPEAPLRSASAHRDHRSRVGLLHDIQPQHLVQPSLAVLFIECVDDLPHDLKSSSVSANRFRGQLNLGLLSPVKSDRTLHSNSYSYPDSPRRAPTMRSNCWGAAQHCGTAKRTDEARNIMAL